MNAVSDASRLDVGAILERLHRVAGVENDNQLARAEGVAQTTVSTWRAKERVPYELCVSMARKYQVSLDWLLLGKSVVDGEITIRRGFIDPNIFRTCYRHADKVKAIKPDLNILDIAAELYNMRLPLFERLEERGLKYDQALTALEINYDAMVDHIGFVANFVEAAIKEDQQSSSQMRSEKRDHDKE